MPGECPNWLTNTVSDVGKALTNLPAAKWSKFIENLESGQREMKGMHMEEWVWPPNLAMRMLTWRKEDLSFVLGSHISFSIFTLTNQWTKYMDSSGSRKHNPDLPLPTWSLQPLGHIALFLLVFLSGLINFDFSLYFFGQWNSFNEDERESMVC